MNTGVRYTLKKVNLSWGMVEAYVDHVAKVYTDFKFTGVYGFPRGGLVLAVMISHRMGIPLLMSPSKGCLIVDDICDSGETLLHYMKNSSALNKPDYAITTMVYKENDLVTPDYYWGIKKDEWIVFPWEDKECIE